MKILITGATGNVGLAVIKSLVKNMHATSIVAGVRDLNSDKQKLAAFDIECVAFDFENNKTYRPALQNCDILFLLRPPQISNTEKYFKPLIAIAKEVGVTHIVFLSVQGVEKSSIIPHYKIEKLIVESGINYTFLRPAYFMQNFLGTLNRDLVQNKKIFLPAGRAKFTLVDVTDVGDVAALIVSNVKKHINKSYELTNNEKLTFEEMAMQLSNELGFKVRYESPNLFHFYWAKRKEKMPSMLILVMIMLHYLPRLQEEPNTTNWVSTLLQKQPTTFKQFINKNKKSLVL